jgi:glutathionyl-hydroquinone reductase
VSTAFSLDRETRSGRFERQESTFRDRPAAPVAGRYHLYVALACPWSHRAVIVRRLKGLEDAIGISYAAPYRDQRGWAFPGDGYRDELHGWSFLREGYERTQRGYAGRITVPVLWDREEERIVNNESQDIVRILNADFQDVARHPELDLYPEELRDEIDALNERIYHTLNNGVYRAGFATTQSAYEKAVVPLFETLDWLEDRLESRAYLCGDRITEADVRLFPTLFRFDAIYVGHFKCNIRRLVDYPRLWAYTRRLYQDERVRRTTNLMHARHHYYESHRTINPTGIVPVGPEIDFDQPA